MRSGPPEFDQAIRLLTEAIGGDLTFAPVPSEQGDRGADAVLRGPSGTPLLLLQLKSTRAAPAPRALHVPSDARLVLAVPADPAAVLDAATPEAPAGTPEQVRARRDGGTERTDAFPTVWVLRRSTPRLREDLRRVGMSFVDAAAGVAHIRLPWLIVDRTDLTRRPTQSVGPGPVDPFGDRNSRVVRLLLRDALGLPARPRPTGSAATETDRGKAWGVRELAAATGVDRTTTSRILRRLAQWDLLHLERRGRAVAATVPNPLRLIDRWSASYDWTANASLAVHAPIGSPERFVHRLRIVLGETRWALTLQGAAALVAPHASWDRIHVYVDVQRPQDLAALAATQDWAPGQDGRLVLLAPFYRASLWDDVTEIRGVASVGLPQLLLDLWRYPVRGREQAEHLFEIRDRLDPSLWRAASRTPAPMTVADAGTGPEPNAGAGA